MLCDDLEEWNGVGSGKEAQEGRKERGRQSWEERKKRKVREKERKVNVSTDVVNIQ